MLYTSKRLVARIVFLLPASAVLLGMMIYVLARPDEPAAFLWARSHGMDGLLDALRPGYSNPVTTLPSWIVYSLPNALWAFAYSILITRIWAGNRQLISYFWMATIPVLVLSTELLQYPEILPGTFSIADLIAGILGMAAGFIIAIKSKHQLL